MRCDRPKVLVEKTYSVHTYAELWHASKCVLEAGRLERRGSSWQFLSSLVLTAFAFEAYLNHVGPHVLACWQDLKQLPPLSKFALLCEILKVDFPGGRGARPIQTLSELFAFRNTVAHGKTEKLTESEERAISDNLDEKLGERLQPLWQRQIQTDEFANRAREDVEEVLRRLYDAWPGPKQGEKEDLFRFGIGLHSATVIGSA